MLAAVEDEDDADESAVVMMLTKDGYGDDFKFAAMMMMISRKCGCDKDGGERRCC